MKNKMLQQDPKGTHGHPSIQMQLVKSDVQLFQHINLKFFKRNSEMKSWEETQVHIHKVSLTWKSMHEDTFALLARLNQHHIRAINVTKLNLIEKLDNGLHVFFAFNGSTCRFTFCWFVLKWLLVVDDTIRYRFDFRCNFVPLDFVY